MVVKHLKKSYLLITVFILSMFILAACSSDKESTKDQGDDLNQSTPQSGGTITIAAAEEPDTLDPHKTGMNVASRITGLMGASLLTNDPETNEIKPFLADSYTVSKDGKTITLKIRQGIVFHDGTPLTAKVYKETFDRILNPETGAKVAANFIAGIKTVSAPDDQTLVIELVVPSAPFLSNLALEGYLQPLSLTAIEKQGDDYGRNPVGVGPWKFKEWVNGQSITLVRNEEYKWSQSFYENKEKAYPEKLVYKFIKDTQTMLAALDSGSVDIVNAAAKDAQRYRNNKKFEVLEIDSQGIGLFLEMNIENKILKDTNVRKAINMALNKETIIKAVLNGEGKPANGPLPPTIFGYDPNVESYGNKYNQENAIKLLESSGWSKNSTGIMEKDGEVLRFELLTDSTHKQPAQIVQAMFKEIGIDLSIQTIEAGTLMEKVSKGEYEISFLKYTYNDPDVLYILFHSSQIGGLNHARVQNAKLDALLEQGRTTIETEERKKIYAEAQKIIVEEAYWAPIYTQKEYYIVNKRVQGLKLSNSNGLLIHDSWVKQ
ncbi:ABC transporter substrate-binding protein [Viridibacillus arvi]|uniref:ABC transporter substrate-binding protein n=1 Tax=Viridibacillus arvi TaxID=263475 RepID=UPI003CFF571B